MGPEALPIWAENITGENALYGENAYFGACNEVFAWAEMFCSHMAERYRQKNQESHLEQAVDEFGKAQSIMNNFSSLFPMSWNRDFTNGDREKEADILLKAKPQFEMAISHLEKAIAAWE